MRDYILKRLATVIPILIGISFLAFDLISLSPSNPAEVALRVNEIVPTEEAVKSMEEQLGINKPYFERYVTWLTDSLHGDFGNSYVNNKPVILIIINDFPGVNNEVNNVYDIYNNQYDDKCLDFLFQKYYLFQLRSNNELTKILYEMNNSEFEIYKHENLLKDRI